jgi:hypothetical protein
MRRRLCAVLCSCILGLGSLMAGELTTAQAQQLASAAQSAQAGGKPVEATLAIGGKNVVFTVTRDAVGNVIARPIPGPDSAGIGISQVSIQMRADASGVLVPVTLVVISSTQTVASYSVQVNADGSIASLYQAGNFAGGGAGAAPTPVVGGIGSPASGRTTAVVATSTAPAGPPADRYPGFTSGQLPLPAGAGTGEVSQSRP